MNVAAYPTTDHSISVLDTHDGYVAAAKQLPCSVYHHPGWRAAFEVYGLRTNWLVALRDEKPVGLLPLVRQSSKLFGKQLTSLPWVDEAGAIGEPEAVEQLLQHASQLSEECGPGFSLVVKQSIGSQVAEDRLGWSSVAGDKVLMSLELAPTAEELWARFSPKVRNQIRKAEKNGLVTESGGGELVKEFYHVYSHNMRDLGSPSHSLQFFQSLVGELGQRATVYCTRHNGVTVGAGLTLDNGQSLDIPWASSLLAYNRLCVNHAMYWRMISDACVSGHQRFHFGRSSGGSGQHRFKKQWGANEKPLSWRRYDGDSQPQGLKSTSEMKEQFGLAERIWTKLPLWVSRKAGPQIIRHVP